MMMAAMLAIVLVAAAPASAQFFAFGDDGFDDDVGILLNDDFNDDEVVCFEVDGFRCVPVDDGFGGFGGFVDGSQEFEQEDIQSGEAEPVVEIVNTGDNANLCPTVLQSANSGNVQNQQGVVHYNSTADDIEFEGSSITMAPEAAGSCDQTIQQSGAAGR